MYLNSETRCHRPQNYYTFTEKTHMRKRQQTPQIAKCRAVTRTTESPDAPKHTNTVVRLVLEAETAHRMQIVRETARVSLAQIIDRCPDLFLGDALILLFLIRRAQSLPWQLPPQKIPLKNVNTISNDKSFRTSLTGRRGSRRSLLTTRTKPRVC